MDASHQPEKPLQGAGAVQGSDNASDSTAKVPRIESPSLAPDQGEPAVTETASDDATPSIGGTALVLAAVKDETRGDSTTSARRAAFERVKTWRLNKFSSLAASLVLAIG